MVSPRRRSSSMIMAVSITTGTGIGLDLARSLVELHYGTISAHNLEQGCEFVIFLPLGSEHLKADEMVTEPDVETATKAALEYVGRLKEMVTPAWQEHYLQMFERIFALPQVRVSIAEVGRQKGTTFNRNMVASFVHLMLEEKGIFLMKGSVEKAAEELGVNKVTIYSYLDEIRGKG